jgi:regulatory protein
MDFSAAQLRLYAMNLLARREYSASELQDKLRSKTSNNLVIDEVVRQLQVDGLQSDQRFAEAFVRMRLRQGKGKRLVARELQQKGIPTTLIQEFLAEDNQWEEALRDLIQRRFSGQIATEPKQKARQLRYLQARGFTYEQIRSAIDSSEEEIRFFVEQ